MNIRSATKEDVDQIVSLLNKTPEVKTVPEQTYTKTEIRNKVPSDSHITLVVEEDSEIIGLIHGEIFPKDPESFITFLVVKSAFRGKGYGEELLKYYITICKSKGIEKLTYLVQTTNDIMIAWSKKNAFKQGHSFYYFEKEI